MKLLDQRGAYLIVHLPVELDHHCTEEIRREIDTMLQEKPISELEFDFSKTIFMDSAGIGMILGRYKIIKALDGRIKLSHLSRQIRKILLLSGILEYIHLDKEEVI